MERKQLFAIAILILAFTLLAAPRQEITGHATADPTSSVTLDTTKFAVNAPLKGTIKLDVAENLDPNEILTVTIGSQTYSYTIENLLKQINFTIDYESSEFNGTDESPTKLLTFTGADSQYIGFKIPRYAEVTGISFTLEANASKGSYPSAVSMDFGAEGTPDWSYLGTFSNYAATTISSEDLDGTAESTGQINTNETYYCEFLDIPTTKHLNISAEYTRVGSKGNLTAVILSVPSENPKVGWSGGSDTCDLPETGKNSCQIALDYTIEGKYLVCIYSSGADTGETLYEIPLDTSQETDTAFTCPRAENSVCQESGFNNFFISVQAGSYNNELSGTIDVAQWEAFTDAILTGVKYYVGSDPYNGLCKATICSVPVNITSLSAGNLNFNDLSLVYVYNDITQSSTTFYDMELPQADITGIEGQELEQGAAIEIPLEALGISVDTVGDYTMMLTFLGASSSAVFSVREAAEVLDAETLINTATSKYLDFLDKDSEEYKILLMLDKTQKIENVLDELDTLKNQLGFTEENVLLAQVEETLNDIPWEITASQTLKDILRVEPTDIPAGLGDEEEIYLQQEAVTVVGTSKTVTVENYNEDSSTYTLIHKEITAKEDITDAKLYETASLAFSDILYTSRPSSISGAQAEYSLTLTEGETAEYFYLTSEAVSVDDFVSVIMLAEEVQEEPSYFCGDDVCDAPYEDEDSCATDCGAAFPWLIVILVILLGAIGIAVVLLRKKIFKKKPAIKEEPLVTYLKKGIAKGSKKEELIGNLKKKGWKDADIQSAVKKAGL